MRLNLNDNIESITAKLSEGNTGARQVIFELMQSENNIWIKVLPLFIIIDILELYGESLYILWNDCCDRNIEEMKNILKLYNEGKITKEEINDEISDKINDKINDFFDAIDAVDFADLYDEEE